MASWETVREVALSLPQVEEGTAYGRRAFRVGGKLFAALRREDVMALRLGFEEKEFVLQSQPETFFVTPHYDGTPWVLVRLSAIGEEQLREVLTEAWLFRAPKRLAASFTPPADGRS